MTLSRWPILSARLHILPKFKTGPVFNMVAGFLETVIDAPGGALRHYNVHLCDVTPDERLAQIARLFEVLWSAPQEGGAWTGADSDWQTENSPPMPECLGRHRPSRGRRHHLPVRRRASRIPHRLYVRDSGPCEAFENPAASPMTPMGPITSRSGWSSDDYSSITPIL
jgi:endonuclease/exonuclease/phosphatase family metal-dependent hydrolase